MIYDQKLRALRPLSFSEIRNNMPELYRLGYDFFVHAFQPPIDSSEMKPSVWIDLARVIEQHYDYYDGFVILHGSDTMAFTASALSFLLENLAKPVILTGSQLPIGEIRTDAKENIITALEIAAAQTDDQHAYVPEVCIYFDYMLFRGNRAKKYNAEKFEAFYSMNYPPLAEAGINIKYHQDNVLAPPKEAFKIHQQLDANIGVLRLFPGITPAFVEAVLKVPGLKGVVMETFGSGNAHTDKWFIDKLKAAIDKGIIILDITQCDGGSVELGRYSTSIHLREIGIVSGFDMTFEAAVTKMMFLLGQGLCREEVIRQLQLPLRGELTEAVAKS